MKVVINFESKFNIGDRVTFDNGFTIPFSSTVVDIKLSQSYKFLYKLDGHSVWYTEDSIHEPKTELA